MISRKVRILSLAAICLLFGSTANAAEQGTVNVMIPWDGEGRVFQVTPDSLMFLGAIEGVMYIESSQGDMHEAFIICPIMQELDLETGDTSALGRCEITVSSESVAYAKLSCKGQVGICEGDFTLVGGEGKLAGISGSGKLRVRSPIRALAHDLGTGALLRIASGLAVIDELKFKIP